jgi:hypothetical protein
LNLHLFSIPLQISVDIIVFPATLVPPPNEAIYEDLEAAKTAPRTMLDTMDTAFTAAFSWEQRAVYMCSKGGNYAQ